MDLSLKGGERKGFYMDSIESLVTEHAILLQVFQRLLGKGYACFESVITI
jgi:hypothetical protein